MFLSDTGIPSNVATPLGIGVAITGGLSLVVAVATLVKAVVEFKLQNSLKRFEKYQEMNEIYSRDATMTAMRDVLRAGGVVLEKYDPIEKYKFMAFYEDIAVMCQSGLMRIEVAAYMFGYDARIAWVSQAFVANLGDAREDPNWALFWSFCNRLDAYRTEFDRKDSQSGDSIAKRPKWPVDKLKF